jgi:hypothetical protein
MARNTAKSLIKNLVFRCRLHRLRFFRNECYILAYHMICDEPNGFFPESSLETFIKQIKYLIQNYRVLPLVEIAQRMSGGKSVRRCAAVTFDDGFRDNYEKAFPILKQLQIPATIFLTTGFVESGQAPWFIEFRYLFMQTPKSRLEIKLAGQTQSFPLANPLEKRSASDMLMNYMQSCPNEERLSILRLLPSILDVDLTDRLQSLMLTWDQIREMSQNGISFGAHTVTHPVLTRISPDTLRREVSGSKATIEEKTGLSVNVFAYPFGKRGHYPRSAPMVLKDLGFLCAVTTEPGANSPNTPIYELKRSHPMEMSFVLSP